MTGPHISSEREQNYDDFWEVRRENIYDSWERIAENLYYEAVEVEEFKILVYNTYDYFSRSREYNSVLRADLPVYRHICTVQSHCDIPDGNTEAEFMVCKSMSESLCWVIENNFRRGYYKMSMPLELSYHGSRNEADMSSFDSFSKAFDELIGIYKEEFEEDDEYEEEED